MLGKFLQIRDFGRGLVSPLKASVNLRGMDGIDLGPEFFSIQIDSDSKSKIEYRFQRMDADKIGSLVDDDSGGLEQLLDSEVSGPADNLADSEDEPTAGLEATDDDLDAILSECLVTTQDEPETGVDK